MAAPGSAAVAAEEAPLAAAAAAPSSFAFARAFASEGDTISGPPPAAPFLRTHDSQSVSVHCENLRIGCACAEV